MTKEIKEKYKNKYQACLMDFYGDRYEIKVYKDKNQEELITFFIKKEEFKKACIGNPIIFRGLPLWWGVSKSKKTFNKVYFKQRKIRDSKKRRKEYAEFKKLLDSL